MLRDEDYYDLFEESDPIDTSFWRTNPGESTHHSSHEMHSEDHGVDPLWMTDDEPEDSERN